MSGAGGRSSFWGRQGRVFRHAATPARVVGRVAFVAPTLGQGGAEKQLVYMALSLRAEGLAVAVLTFAHGEHHEAALREAGVEVRTFEGGRLGRLRWLVGEARRFRPDALVASHFYANPYVGLVGRALRIPSFGAVRNEVAFEVADAGRLGWLGLRLPTHLIANSEAARAAAGPGTSLLANALDLDAFDDDAAAGPGPGALDLGPDPVVVSVANHRPEKRLDVFLEGVAALRERGVAVTGLLVGDGSERARLEAMAGRLGIADHVRFLGRRDDVPAILARADVLLLTSDHEGFPNVVMEAMAARLPVVATDAGDNTRFVRDGVTGFVVPKGDPEAAADAVARILADPAGAKAMGDAAREWVEERYGVDDLAERLLAVLGG